ncbi:interferon gamma receptor 1 isoform X2 [Pteronotus mesoamericanus]|uniref:interferon gamma receptor 1 isoform X2 n=1 Tax=Pteronotus mesoamericanus TaxID=1884717 RepID=UPI0023ECE54B|nr:interferon gamma receptor 1 isoform X2 [Pteronotus parnellii mesoamericanus]
MALLLFVLITQAASRAEMSAADPELSSVPIPTNVTIEANNLNAFVHWDYPTMQQTPFFTVEVKTYEGKKWSNACNTSHHQCNIFFMIDNPMSSLWARVNAKVGEEESAFAESEEFILCKQCTIIEQELEATYDDVNCHTLTYNVYVRMNGTLITLKEDDCNGTWCHLTIPGSSLSSEYCISVDGIAEEKTWTVKTERSKELCGPIFDHKSVEDSVWIPIVAAVLLFLILVLVVVCCNLKKINPFKRKNIMLPKSLVSVVKNASSEAKSESKYISPVTYKPIIPENEKVFCEEQWSPASISSTLTEDEPGKGENKEDLSSETEVVITEENTSDVAPDSPETSARKADSAHSSSNQSEPCSIALNSYHSRNGSDSGVVASDSFLSDLEFPPNNKTEINTGQPEPVMLRHTTSSFGYDKPHVVVELPVDEGVKESLIGYRVTGGSKEFS